ncbi:MAG: adenylate/guanylate cyclase domain-containing protein [Mycobacteriales bacterium]
MAPSSQPPTEPDRSGVDDRLEAGQRLDQSDRLDETLLGGPREYTRQQVAERSGVPLEHATRLWRAMGFPDAGDDERVFTHADAEALRGVWAMVDNDVIDIDMAVSLARGMGQALSVLADSQIRAGNDALRRHFGDAGAQTLAAAARTTAEELFPQMRDLVVYVYRRQLAAASARLLAGSPEELDSRPVTVGFADLVSFTTLTRSLGSPDLGRLVEGFESAVSDRVAQHRGRVVKTIGDEVFFACDDLTGAAEIALDTAAEHGAREDLPDVRVGLACGPVLARLGDVYGPVVNIASRLTALARPNTVLLDREAAAGLSGRPEYDVIELRRQKVSGYDHLKPWVLRRAGT